MCWNQATILNLNNIQRNIHKGDKLTICKVLTIRIFQPTAPDWTIQEKKLEACALIKQGKSFRHCVLRWQVVIYNKAKS